MSASGAPVVDPAGLATREAAPAKINLALHVTGRRDDGYHLLDTLVVHGIAADTVSARPIDAAPGTIDLSVEGPFAAGLAGEGDNLVLRAARLLATEARRLGREPAAVALTLDKHLPIASGIGGGSSDAAATLRLLDRLWGLDLAPAALARLSLPLGADLPMCVLGRPLRARGIGEIAEPAPSLPELHAVLVNPGIAVSTPAVFRALARRDGAPLADLPAAVADLDALVALLDATRNDLEAPAIAVAPVIAEVLAALCAAPGCRFARMSGSGATCFGLFVDASTAADAADALRRARPGWWAAAGVVPSHRRED